MDFVGKQRINYQKSLRDIAKSMVRLKRPERLLKIITRFIDRKVGVSHTSLLILEEKKKRFTFVDSLGNKRFPIGFVKMELDHPFIEWFDPQKGLNEDFLYRPRLIKKRNIPGRSAHEVEKIISTMDKLKIELAVPGYYKDTLLGLLLLGGKTNGRQFYPSEISFFQVLVQDCSMAVKTAEYHRNLEEQNKEMLKRIEEIEVMRKKEHETYYQIMRCLAEEVHAKDAYTFGHIHQVERLGIMTATEMGMDLTGKKKDVLSASLILHDVGKIGIPDAILKKQGRLDPEEWKVMRTHAEKGARILGPLSDFQEVAEIVRCHHENYDGSGYPRGLKNDEIPVEARIVSVVDAFHAIVSTRCYSKGRPVEFALEELTRCAGTQFDPVVVEAFCRSIKREMKKRGVGFFLDDCTDGTQVA